MAYGHRSWIGVLSPHACRVRVAHDTNAWGASEPIYSAMLPSNRESGSFSYDLEKSVFGTTINNVGTIQKILIHPLGDGYHTLHHMFPTVPAFRLGRLHRALKHETREADKDGTLNRQVVRQDPDVGFAGGGTRFDWTAKGENAAS